MGSVRRSASTRRPRTARGGGTMRTPWRSACAPPRQRSSRRSSTPGSAAGRVATPMTPPTSSTSRRSRAAVKPSTTSLIPGETHALRRLLPDAAETTVAEQLAGLDFKPLARPERPYLILNFATTRDGRAAIGGKSGPIGSATDSEMLLRLRTRVDAVMIGAGTMRAERYGPIVPDAQLRAYRDRTLLSHDPLAVIISNRLELPSDPGLVTDGAGRRVTSPPSGQDPPESATSVKVVRHPDGVELDRAMESVRKERGIRSVLCEGGPTLHGRLREGGLADELFLTIAPKIAGGEGPRILEGALADVDDVELGWLLASNSELFARYRGMTSPPSGA